MRTNLLFLSVLIISTAFTGCGKKPNDQKPEIKNEQLVPIDTSLEEETHKELKVAIENNDENEVLRLLEFQNQIDLNIILDNGETLLTMAIERNLVKVVNKLISNGAHSWKQNANKLSPLMVATKFRHTSLAKNLVALGVPLEAVDFNKDTALIYAIRNLDSTLAIYLIESGANIEHVNAQPKSVLNIAIDHNLHDVVALIKIRLHQFENMPNLETLKIIIKLGDLQTLDALLKEFPDLKTAYPSFNYYIYIMEELTHDKALAFFYLFRTHNINLEDDSNALTPLAYTIKNEMNIFAKLILDQKIKINRIDQEGKTPLIMAIEKNNLEIVTKLLSNGAEKKYSYRSEQDKKITVKACKVIKDVRKSLNAEEKKTNTDIRKKVKCTLLDFLI